MRIACEVYRRGNVDQTGPRDPEVAGGPITPGRSRASLAAVRTELARHLNRHVFPASPRELVHALRRAYAPDALIDPVERLPRAARYSTVQQLAEALAGAGPERRA